MDQYEIRLQNLENKTNTWILDKNIIKRSISIWVGAVVGYILFLVFILIISGIAVGLASLFN